MNLNEACIRVLRFNKVEIAIVDGEDTVAGFNKTEAARLMKIEGGIGGSAGQAMNFNCVCPSVPCFDEIHIFTFHNPSAIWSIIDLYRRDSMKFEGSVIVVSNCVVNFDDSRPTVESFDKVERIWCPATGAETLLRLCWEYCQLR